MELTENIRQYIADRCAKQMELLIKERAKAEVALEVDAFAVFDLAWQERKQALLNKFKASNWLSDAANRAGQISLVTHALKYVHSDAKGSSLMLNSGEKASGIRYLISKSLSTLKADVVGNAAALDVANLLLLEANGKCLLDHLAEDDATPLASFGSVAQQDTWLQGFKQALRLADPASHALAKQLYFPVPEAASGYHLLAPLAASSLNQAVFQRIQARFSDESKAAREAKKKGVYWHEGTRNYPALAIQTFGGTKPQNISWLNAQRGGRVHLFNSQPPLWHSQIKPPKSIEAFWSGYRWRIRQHARDLKSFLAWADAQSLNNRYIRAKRATMVADMVGELHHYAALVQQLPSGWSAANWGLSPEACWLDLGRSDAAFVAKRQGKAWCKLVAQTFGRVLSKALTAEKLTMADDETVYFGKQLQAEVNRLMMDFEALA